MDSPSKIRTSAKVCLPLSTVVLQYEGEMPHKATRPSRKPREFHVNGLPGMTKRSEKRCSPLTRHALRVASVRYGDSSGSYSVLPGNSYCEAVAESVSRRKQTCFRVGASFSKCTDSCR